MLTDGEKYKIINNDLPADQGDQFLVSLKDALMVQI